MMSLLTAAVTCALEGAGRELEVGDAAGDADEPDEEQALALSDKAITRTAPSHSISGLDRIFHLPSFGLTHRA
jgi:hypothetical protein